MRRVTATKWALRADKLNISQQKEPPYHWDWDARVGVHHAWGSTVGYHAAVRFAARFVKGVKE